MVPSRGPAGLLLVAVGLAAAACVSRGPEGLPEADGLVRRGDEALNAGRLDEARALFLQATVDAPRAFLAWVGLSRTAAARGDGAELDRALAEAMARDPGSPQSADLLGRTLLGAARASRRPDARYGRIALGYFRRASEKRPDLPALRYHTGLAAWTAGDLDLAVAALDAAHREEPTAATPLRALLDLHRERGDRAAVRRLLDGVAARTGGALLPSFDEDARFAAGADAGAASRP